MSYQIKSTPYFRRMFNNSKKNGQLQKLREEYERIQEFNDRTIELKMRQVRLKRLFREIEDMKAAAAAAAAAGGSQPTSPNRSRGASNSPTPAARNLQRRNHNVRLTNITPEQKIREQRVENLARARELGKEISRRNAEMAEAGTGGFLRSELRLTAKMQAVADARKDADERRERAAKRISYGNDQSRQNLQRLLQVRQRKLGGGHAQAAGNRSHLQPDDQVPITQQLPRQEIRPSYLYPDYRQLTPSQLQLLEVENKPSTQVLQIQRDQEENELMLRLKEQELRMEAQLRQQEADFSDQEDHMHFCRQASSMSSPDEENSEEQRLIRLRLQNPELADELERRRRRQQEDEEEEEQLQRRLRHLHEETSPLRLARISLSSTEGTNATNVTVETAATSPMNVRFPYQEMDPIDSNLEVHTAPLATNNENRLGLASLSATIASHQPTQSVPYQTDYPIDQDSASNRWRQISLMLPWFKAFPDLESESPVIPPPPDNRMNVEPSNYEMRDEMVPAPGPQANPTYSYQLSDVATQAEEEPFPPPHCEFLLSTFDFIGTAER
ncbi:trichohyalin [Drosophila subpulchrella]|uniref:trichohyalin n=1 Tax=Drosophila subpulchrella TaxID=1486046 RepID=UPI0018A177AF|nr:trichohyalin [Drosophila subpulchrella]